MDLRTFLAWAEERAGLQVIDVPVDPHLEMARVMHALEGRPLLFSAPRRPGWRVATGICASRQHFAWALGLGDSLDLVPRMLQGLQDRIEPLLVPEAPCQEVVVRQPNLDLEPAVSRLAKGTGLASRQGRNAEALRP